MSSIKRFAQVQMTAATFIQREADAIEAGRPSADPDQVEKFHVLIRGQADVAAQTAESLGRLAIQEQQLTHNQERHTLEKRNLQTENALNIAKEQRAIYKYFFEQQQSVIQNVQTDNVRLRSNHETEFCKTIDGYRIDGKVCPPPHSQMSINTQFEKAKETGALTPLICALYYEYHAEIILRKLEKDSSVTASLYFAQAIKNYLEIQSEAKSPHLISCLDGIVDCQLPDSALDSIRDVCQQAMDVYLKSLRPLKENTSPAELLYCLSLFEYPADIASITRYIAVVTCEASASTNLNHLLARLSSDGFTLQKKDTLHIAPFLQKLIHPRIPASALFSFTSTIPLPPPEVDRFGKLVPEEDLNIQIKTLFKLAANLSEPISKILAPQYVALWHEVEAEKILRKKLALWNETQAVVICTQKADLAEWNLISNHFTKALDLYSDLDDLPGVARCHNGMARKFYREPNSDSMLAQRPASYDHQLKALRYWYSSENDSCPQILRNYNELKQIFPTYDDDIFCRDDPFFEFVHIKKLSMCSRELQDVHAPAIARYLENCLQLSQLDLSNNDIGDQGVLVLSQNLPKTVTDLILRNNVIGDKGVIALTKHFEDSSTLSKLDLSNNTIGNKGAIALAECFGASSRFSELNLSDNNIGYRGAIAIGKCFKNSDGLKSLNLSDNSIEDKGAIAITENFTNLNQLVELDLCDNNISIEVARDITVILKHLPQLSTLNFTRNIENQETTAEPVENSPQLSTLNFNRNPEYFKDLLQFSTLNLTSDIGNQETTAEHFKDSPRLHLDDDELRVTKIIKQRLLKTDVTHLDLSENSLGSFGAKILGLHLQGAVITHLDIHDNRLGAEGAKALGSSLPSTSITYLNLNSNTIGDEGAIEIAPCLSKTNITHLDLSCNGISESGASAIANGLVCSNINQLDLSNNDIGDQGVLVLSQNLPKTVTDLILRNNVIGDKGVIALTKHFEDSNTLSKLDLSNNTIGSEGAIALAECFGTSSRFSELNLSDNNIGYRGAIAIAKRFKDSDGLKSLNLSDNSIGDKGAIAITENFKNLNQFVELDLSDNNISIEVAFEISLMVLGRFWLKTRTP